MSGVWYFAYGSNLCRRIFEERRGICPRERVVGHIAGWSLCFDLSVGPGERGVANVVERRDARVYGVAYLVTAAEAEILDRTEGVAVGYYARRTVDVTAADGRIVTAFTYQSARGTTGRKPSPRYMGLILNGAREHGLPAAWIEWLESLPLAHDERTDVS
jgi:cation transport regulator ChaC